MSPPPKTVYYICYHNGLVEWVGSIPYESMDDAQHQCDFLEMFEDGLADIHVREGDRPTDEVIERSSKG